MTCSGSVSTPRRLSEQRGAWRNRKKVCETPRDTTLEHGRAFGTRRSEDESPKIVDVAHVILPEVCGSVLRPATVVRALSGTIDVDLGQRKIAADRQTPVSLPSSTPRDPVAHEDLYAACHSDAAFVPQRRSSSRWRVAHLVMPSGHLCEGLVPLDPPGHLSNNRDTVSLRSNVARYAERPSRTDVLTEVGR